MHLSECVWRTVVACALCVGAQGGMACCQDQAGATGVGVRSERGGGTANPITAKYRFLGKFVDSFLHGYTYGYAPAIVHARGLFHMFYCSNGIAEGDWDSIRYSVSEDGRAWSVPQVVLRVTDLEHERAACDPSVVYFQGAQDDSPYYYLFYSGNAVDMQTVVFVARSRNIAGPYYKYVEPGEWEGARPAPFAGQYGRGIPKVVLRPRHPTRDRSGDGDTDPAAAWYGAGQQTVLAKEGRLYMWYTDDTLLYPTRKIERLLVSSSYDPTQWPTAEPALTPSGSGSLEPLGVTSVDVKYDESGDEFVMFDIEGDHLPRPRLSTRSSKDGVRWSEPAVVCGGDCLSGHAHNPGVSGDPQGHLGPETALLAYEAPHVPGRDQWGMWDLYGAVLTFTPLGEHGLARLR